MNALIVLIFIVIVLPLILVIIGLVKLFSSDENVRKKALPYILGGIAMFGLFALIGFSICSNMSPSGFH